MQAPADHPPPSPSPLSRDPAAFVGAIVGVCAVAALLVSRDVGVTPLALDALFVFALLGIAAAARKQALRDALPLGVLPLAALVVVGTQAAIGRSFVDGAGPLLIGVWVLLITFGAAILSGIAGPPGARLFAVLVRPMARVGSRVLPVLSGILLASATLLVAVSLARAVRMPSPDGYIASLPSIGVIPPVTGEPSMIEKGPTHPSGTPMLTRIYDMKLGEVGIRRLCPSLVQRCFLEVKPPGRPFDVQYVTWLTESDRFIPVDRSSRDLEDRMWVDPGASIVVRRASLVERGAYPSSPESERYQVLVLDGEIYRTPRYREPGVAVLQEPWFQTIGMSMRSIAGAISAPRGWIAIAACGVLLTAALLVHRARVLRGLSRIEKARPAVLEESGWLTFADGSPPVRAGDRGLPVGPVLVLEPRSASAYRGAASPGGELLAGEQQELLERGRDLVAQLDVTAFAVAALAPLPLLTAALTLKLW
ncbi:MULTISPECIES: hypothetical protein [Sorangium]|uniref:hypothetical protein n=1 Tax=Sorangium TaxID=39643 RepID=UPI003D9C2C20